MSMLKVVVEKHADCYVAYPLGVDGAVVGEGASFDEALDDVRSAIREYVEVFGVERLNLESPVLEARVVEAASGV